MEKVINKQNGGQVTISYKYGHALVTFVPLDSVSGRSWVCKSQ